MSSGHIRRRGKASWELKFDVGTDSLSGRRITKFRSFKGTKREALAELARLITTANQGDYIDPSKATLAAFLDRWERDWATINVSPKTLERYIDLLRLHVRPHLGAVRIQKLQAAHLAELYARLLREGLGPDRGLSARTVGHVHRVLHKALAVAVEWGVVQRNAADLAKPPKVEDTEVEILDEAQVRDVLRKLRGDSLYTYAIVALATGMRRGEMLALRSSDVDLIKASIRVEQSLEQTRAGLRFKAPKTRSGRRAIALPESVVTQLRLHRIAQQELRLKLGLGKASDDALVFPNPDGSPRSPNAVTKAWATAVSKHQLPRVSLHALRHTHASQLIASGMDVLTISRRLGHGSPTITLAVYGHMFKDTDAEAANVVERAFGAALTE
jgi:integrase